MTNERGTRTMTKKSLVIQMVVAIALAGCSELASSPQSSCEVMVEQICSTAAAAQLLDGTLAVNYSSRPEEPQVVPLIVPVSQQNGALAAEVDCYVNTESRNFSIVHSDLAIPPRSEESVEFLRSRHLCADTGSYAKGPDLRLETVLNDSAAQPR
jgi:hypothetical protein